MPTFSSLSSLMNHIKNNVLPDILQNEVFEEVRDVEQKHIQSDVYDVYSPDIYERRLTNDGLIADENIVGNVVGSTLEVKNVTEPDTRYGNWWSSGDTNLPALIEFGDGHNGNYYTFEKEGAAYLNPRPFTQNTIDELSATKAHVKAAKNGLKRKGFNVK